MTNQNNAAQPSLTNAEILHRWDTHVGEPDSGRPLTDSDKIIFARAIEVDLLSKLRATVADERAAFEAEFPLPGGTKWDGTQYIVDPDYQDSYRVNTFLGQWAAWQVRAALASAPVAGEAQPVALYQARTRPTWRTDENAWSKWEDCTAAQAADYERVPLLHDWQYEVRRLYAAPQPSAPAAIPPDGVRFWCGSGAGRSGPDGILLPASQASVADFPPIDPVQAHVAHCLGCETCDGWREMLGGQRQAGPVAGEADQQTIWEVNRAMQAAGWQNSGRRQADLPRVAKVVKIMLGHHAAPQASEAVCNADAEPIAWESTTPVFFKFITDSRYRKFSPAVRKWYRPYRCASCAALSAQPGTQKEQSDEN